MTFWMAALETIISKVAKGTIPLAVGLVMTFYMERPVPIHTGSDLETGKIQL
jgi:hypothetical protein